MKLLITGAGGFVGARLARSILARGSLTGRPIEKMVLVDQVDEALAHLAQRVAAEVVASA